MTSGRVGTLRPEREKTLNFFQPISDSLVTNIYLLNRSVRKYKHYFLSDYMEPNDLIFIRGKCWPKWFFPFWQEPSLHFCFFATPCDMSFEIWKKFPWQIIFWCLQQHFIWDSISKFVCLSFLCKCTVQLSWNFIDDHWVKDLQTEKYFKNRYGYEALITVKASAIPLW